MRNLSEVLIFEAGDGGQQLCPNISVTDDEVLEDTETYTVSLSSNETSVSIDVPTASIVILDEADGKYIVTKEYPILVHNIMVYMHIIVPY